MDLTFDAEQEAFRAEARAWLEAHVPADPLPSLDTAAGFEAHRAWERTMYEDRWSVVSWPVEYGGRDVGIFEWLVFEEEYYRARAPKRVSQNGIFLLAPTMLEYGTDAQKARYLPPMASGDEIWCQGWSEPDAGSDLAGIRSRAARDTAHDGHWILNGQKTWASRGAFADWCFGIFRTDPEAERHRGLTYFLIAMDTPGVTVRPIPQIDGETGFAEIFFDNVEVPEDQVLGEVGAGWSVAMATAGSERGLSLRSPARYTGAADRLLQLYAERGGPAASADAVAQAHMDAEAYKLHTYWTASRVGARPRCGPGGQLQQDLLVRDRRRHPHRRARPARTRGRTVGCGRARRVARRLPLLFGGAHLRRDQRDSAQRGGRAPARTAPGLNGRAVDFAFSDEQEALREGVRTVLSAECAPDALRAFELADEAGRVEQSQNRWAVLAELGAPALVVPEAADGLGLSDVDLVGVLEEAGRACLPEPLLETAALAAPTLAALLPDAAAAAALAALVRDDVSFAVGGIDVTPGGVVSPTEVSADGTLRTPRVVGARDAGLLLLAVRDADSGWQLHAVPAASCTAYATPALSASRDLSTVHWPLGSDTLLAYGVAAEAAVGLLADRAAAGTAALLIGLAERMLSMSAAYAKERHQFGKPIGSFQAVKHLLANARVALEFARPATYRAAWSLATAQPTLSHDASMAKAMASDAADLAARVALQVHGAIGYTWECDLHFFLKETWALSRAWGDAATHRRLVLAQLRSR